MRRSRPNSGARRATRWRRYTGRGQRPGRAREVFLVQQIDQILADVASVTQNPTVEHVSLIDAGNGEALARYVGSFPQVVTEILARIKDTVGIDVTQILSATNAGTGGVKP